jgi:hypothetical protein
VDKKEDYLSLLLLLVTVNLSIWMNLQVEWIPQPEDLFGKCSKDTKKIKL